ncbi:DUF2924 domain-containing protein [Rhodoblastus acidophilus]|uniref:DUF2924 domain-containing protein n=1 Tax=Candidatus Rhodoblastus alkanivorans TaxID=2954117 RepID=A0ABS9Z123_9HYPH|nr:DUF2924 domain-containing protein [Candidatus Rhodoblastus alkanivorans]MCI4678263.1 DUF2924 domain-containing protein [Candidatus Rhodoblastus alkanivorans]MCI4681313.1 DUF2924 domain-containing protein [Candidatus Rhodoblastus alkanivorans]MDI4642360.1 DUF2924 domain-containing protein [Rhodoblastus acidophilus]
MPDHEQIVRPVAEPADDVEKAIARVAAMNIAELRSEWLKTFGSEPPRPFSKDLLARAIAYRMQEDAYGGLNPFTARLLRSLLKRGAEPPRRVKIGSVIVREHKGVLHEVLVTPEGFCWRGKTFGSLSIIAKKITGTSWNGPRFFGLRAKESAGSNASGVAAGLDGGADNALPLNDPRVGKRSGRQSSVRMALPKSGGAP